MFKLSEHVAVSPQITPADIAMIAEAGYKVVINNRPDGEEAGQPASRDIEAAALAAGLEYHYLPVTAADFPGEHFDQMTDLLDDPARPVFAFCRTGTRCANLWVSSRESAEQGGAAGVAQEQGFLLAMADNYLSGKGS